MIDLKLTASGHILKILIFTTYYDVEINVKYAYQRQSCCDISDSMQIEKDYRLVKKIGT